MEKIWGAALLDPAALRLYRAVNPHEPREKCDIVAGLSRRQTAAPADPTLGIGNEEPPSNGFIAQCATTLIEGCQWFHHHTEVLQQGSNMEYVFGRKRQLSEIAARRELQE